MNYFCLFFPRSLHRAVSTETVSLQVCNLFLSKCIQDQYLLQLLRNADSISTWVAAEIVTCHTSKVCHCYIALLIMKQLLIPLYELLCSEAARDTLKYTCERAVNNLGVYHKEGLGCFIVAAVKNPIECKK